MKLSAILFLCFALHFKAAKAQTELKFSGKSNHRFSEYTGGSNKFAAQDHWVQLEQKVELNDFSVKAQINAYAGNFRGDLIQSRDNMSYGSQTSELWPEDLYIQYEGEIFLAKLGYQKIPWQEGFGLSYTNFINARDYRTSIFDDSHITYRSAPMANLIVSGENLSIQGVYLPYSQMDIPPPASRLGLPLSSLLVQGQTVELLPYNSKILTHEYGGRVTWAGEGFDVSGFYFYLKDRQGIYTLSSSSTLTEYKLEPNQYFISVYGLTSSITLDESVVRLEVLQIPTRKISQFTSAGVFTSQNASETAVTVSYDSPNWTHWFFSIQESISVISKDMIDLARRKNEFLALFLVKYDFGMERVLSFTATHHESDHSLLGRVQFNWPYSRSVDFEVGVDFGNDSGLALTYRDTNRAYFEINHTF